MADISFGVQTIFLFHVEHRLCGITDNVKEKRCVGAERNKAEQPVPGKVPL